MAELFLQFNFLRLEKGGYTKSDEFSEKFQRGGVIFNPKFYIADFGNFKQGFLSITCVSAFIYCFMHTYFRPFWPILTSVNARTSK